MGGVSMSQEQTIQIVKRLVKESSKIVLLLGVGTYIESGGENIWSSRECYRMEEKYNKTPDEMFSVEFYSARKDKFFEFYKNEILLTDLTPASLYYDIKKLQETGKIKRVITQNMDSLHNKAGIQDVIELHGNIEYNWCPHCHKKFSADYLSSAKAVPLCDECNTSIRPGVRLFGEKIANDLMTEAVNACESADLILALGTNMNDNMVKFCTGTYNGDRLVLITKEDHYTDKFADIVIHDEVCNILPQIFDLDN